MARRRYGVQDWQKEMDRWSKEYQCSRTLEQLIHRTGPAASKDKAYEPLACGPMLDEQLSELDKRPPLSLILEYCVVRPSLEQNRIVNQVKCCVMQWVWLLCGAVVVAGCCDAVGGLL